MRIHKLYVVVGLLLAFGLFTELVAHAAETNESTKIKFNAPIEIPGQVLPAGTYLFEQANPNEDLNVIRIYNADHTVLYATLEAISAERQHTTDHTSITLSEPESGPPALVKWFYPGRLDGHEFVYGDREEQSIAQTKQETIVVNESTSHAENAGE